MIRLDYRDASPIYEQIIRQTEQRILSGLLPPGSQLPSVRSLSMELSVNPNTIQKAYSDMDTRGLLCSIPGRGCFVSENAPTLLNQYKRQQLGDLQEAIRELALAGISREELIACIDAAYRDIQPL